MGFLFLIFADGMDFVSSFGLLERNPFARDIMHRFDPMKGLLIKGVYEVALGFVGMLFYKAFEGYDKMFAAGVAASVFLVIGLETLMSAAIPNFLIRMGFYVP